MFCAQPLVNKIFSAMPRGFLSASESRKGSIRERAVRANTVRPYENGINYGAVGDGAFDVSQKNSPPKQSEARIIFQQKRREQAPALRYINPIFVGADSISARHYATKKGVQMHFAARCVVELSPINQKKKRCAMHTFF